MLVSEKRILVEWGDCDPADIVFYPRYLEWCDACTSALFAAAGIPITSVFKVHDALGIPMVTLSARYLKPSTYGDELVVRSSVTEFRTSSFNVRHQFFKASDLSMEANETRVWVARDPSDPTGIKMKSQPIPRDVVERLSGNTAQSRV